MASYGEPDWATPGATTAAPTTEIAGTSGGLASPPPRVDYGQDRDNARFLHVLLSVVNIAVSGLMVALGIITWISFVTTFGGNKLNTKEWSVVLLASYMVLFALLLLTYEIMWWAPNGSVNRIIRKNFGFLYGIRGRGGFLIFVACLCLGLRHFNDNTVRILDIAAGLSWLGVGCGHLVLAFTHPTISSSYKPPTAGFLNGGEPQHNNPV